MPSSAWPWLASCVLALVVSACGKKPPAADGAAADAPTAVSDKDAEPPTPPPAPVVIDGSAFLPGPYTVAVVEDEGAVRVEVAGMVDQIPRTVGDTTPRDPGPFKAAKGRGLSGTGYAAHLTALHAFVSASEGLDAAADRVLEHARDSKLVSEAAREEDVVVLIDAADGSPFVVGETAPPVAAAGHDARKIAEERATVYRAHLADGGVILHLKDADLFAPASRRPMLVATLDVFDGKLPEDEANKRLSELWDDNPVVHEWRAEYQADPKLRDALTKGTP